ncbi:MAG: hypothetical protein Q9216_005937, partial [Gyalolechia sp. 2 TL-2023]
MSSHTASQRYFSTRGGSYDLSFEDVILRGLASDGGLFIPEEIPSLPSNWQNDWCDLTFQELAFKIFSLFISPAEIPPSALKDIIHNSYSTFRVPDVAPTVTLDGDKKIYLLELFHGPTFAFKDVALQFLGNLFEYFLVRKNKGKSGKDRSHLTVIGATSGDTGSAAIYGLRGKKDVSVFIMYPTGKVSAIQETQMTTVQDANVHCLSVDGTFDDCQDFVKALFADPLINKTQNLGAVNSINWARILAQIVYYVSSYLSLRHSDSFHPSNDHIRFVVPTGNFGDVLAGFFAKKLGVPSKSLVVATNENDILHRFWQTGTYEKNFVHDSAAEGGFVEDGAKAHSSGVKETLSPAMDILVSSNFERLLWYLAYDAQNPSTASVQDRRQAACSKVKGWQSELKSRGGFSVEKEVLHSAKADFTSERVSDTETLTTIRDTYKKGAYILDPHSAIGVTAALRSAEAEPGVYNVALATAHPAKFSNAVGLALKDEKGFHFKDILPEQFVGLDELPKRIRYVKRSEGLDSLRKLIVDKSIDIITYSWTLSTGAMSRSITPEESPMGSNSASPASKQYADNSQLTPNSKIKAMLAAIDEEADSDSGASIRSKAARPHSTPAQNLTITHRRHSPSHETDSSLAEDDPFSLPAPRGKVAARLNQKPALQQGSPQSDENDVRDAYTRQKKRLAGRSADNPSSKENSPSPEEASLSTDEDDFLPTTTRQNRRAAQLSTLGPKSGEASMAASPRSSPGLFLTPRKEQRLCSPSPLMETGRQNGSGSGLPADPQANQRFLALVARKRAEREAKAKAEAEKQAQKLAGVRERKQDQRDSNVGLLGTSEDDSDVAGGQKLTQQARPTRKASKKALEEMSRETQRMSRNMQLAHQARTKKKITKESLFARFNFRNRGVVQPDTSIANSSSAAASSNPASDAEARLSAESPPTSPVTPDDELPKDPQRSHTPSKSVDVHEGGKSRTFDENLPDIQSIFTQAPEHRNDGKTRATEGQSDQDASYPQAKIATEKASLKKPIDFRLPKSLVRPNTGGESDSDLEVLPVSKPKRKLDVFDRLPAAKASEGRSLQKLHALAHLTSPDKQVKNPKSNMSLMEMQNSLQRRARQQAARERAEKIQDLKDRGIFIQTAEERQKDQAEVEDLLEKARREAGELQQKEKNLAKKQARENGEMVADDSSELDEDYEDNDADESDVDLSGSDEEVGNELEVGQVESEADDVEKEDPDVGLRAQDGYLVEDEASEVSEEDEHDDELHDEAESSDAEEQQRTHAPSRRRERKVLDDEDDESEEIHDNASEEVASVQNNGPSVPDLGFPALGDAPMGLSQAFAATMSDPQTQADTQQGVVDQEEDSLAFLGAPPEPEVPLYDMNDSLEMVLDSQDANHSSPTFQDEIRLDFSQSQVRETPTAESIVEPTATQSSEIPDPTQDVGFILTSPVAGRYAYNPPSTVETVILPQPDGTESPVTKKRGRLTRRSNVTIDNESDQLGDAEQAHHKMTISADAFDVLKRGSKKSSDAVAKFDKKKSNAHEMVEEQAQESEDEYAGLGGASDDESGGDEDEEVTKMIEQGEIDVDERELAAFYADKERASDEKAVEKLFKDINNGMLRRKRGAEFDLSDSDDDAEARRRRKRKEFAKMRKALLANENVGKIAEDPKKMAFLRAIEDREDDEDLDFLEQQNEESSQPVIDIDSQDTLDAQSRSQSHAGNANMALGKRKRPLVESAPNTTNRPPPAARRTPATTTKPSSLADIRASVSFLIEEPDAVPMLPPPLSSSSPIASGDENGDVDVVQPSNNAAKNNSDDGNGNGNGNNPRRTTNPVIDRLSLKRASTSSLSTSSLNNNNNVFFHPPSTTTNFPTSLLLRRATTSSFSSSSLDNPNNPNQQDRYGISHHAATERAAGGGELQG